MGTLSRDTDWYSVLRAVMNDALVKRGESVSGLSLEQNVWHYMDINDPKSVKMMQLSQEGDKQRILVHYPKDSSPYKDPNIGKYKFGEVISGEIYDEITGKKFKANRGGKNDTIEVGPLDKFKPKTEKDKECYVLVEIRVKSQKALRN